MKELRLISEITDRYREILGGKLVGLYVHGSIAFGCFSWERSDIDFLVVVTSSLSISEKEALLSILLEQESVGPAKGFEMSVVLLDTCRNFQYPTPYELHYSPAHREKCLTDLSGYCRISRGVDPDLAAHFTVTRAVGFPVFGPPAKNIFSSVPAEAYWDSLYRDIQDAETDILSDPLYYTLNLCRVLAYRRAGLILSKEQGGLWASSHLPPALSSIVQETLHCYQQGLPFSPDGSTITTFAAKLKAEINRGPL